MLNVYLESQGYIYRKRDLFINSKTSFNMVNNITNDKDNECKLLSRVYNLRSKNLSPKPLPVPLDYGKLGDVPHP